MSNYDVREAGRRIAAESLLEDPLTPYDRAIVGATSVQVRIPLRDPVQTRQALKMLVKTAEECILHIDRGGLKDRSVLFDIRGRIHLVSQKINCYRRLRHL